MASGAIVSVPASSATLVYAAGARGAKLYMIGQTDIYLGGSDVDSTHGVILWTSSTQPIVVELGANESLYAWCATARSITYLAVGEPIA